METIDFDDADARFGIRAILPAYDEDNPVIVLPPGTHAASRLDLDESSYVVDGDLVVTDDVILASEEGQFLVVLGDLTVESLLIGGPIVYVRGTLTAKHAIHCDYNHGYLRVDGDVRANIIAAEHMFRIGGAVHAATTIDLGGLKTSDEAFTPTLTRDQAARNSKQHLVDEVLNDMGYIDGSALADLLASGGNPLR